MSTENTSIDTTTPTPDFRTPWQTRSPYHDDIENNQGVLLVSCTNRDVSARIVTCVNACAGMADPAKEIARLKNCSDELDNILSVIPVDAPCLHAETGETVADYILGLQKEVGRVHELYFNTSQQLKTMREAIRLVIANHNFDPEACIDKLQSLA